MSFGTVLPCNSSQLAADKSGVADLPPGASQLPSSTGSGGKQAGWGDLFAPKYRKAVLIGCMLFLFQQFSGINALIYFSSSVFKQVGWLGVVLQTGGLLFDSIK